LAKADNAVVFTDNHEMQRGEAANYLTFKDNSNHFVYTLGNLFMLAWPYGYPQLMSSYDFASFDDSPPSNGNGATKSIYANSTATTPDCFKEWKCEHRWREISNMVAFRNATFSTSQVNNWWDNGNNQIAFGRGDKGFVVINREDTPLNRSFQTRMPPGAYCDVISGDFSGISPKGSCTGRTITVDVNRNATISVPPNYAAAIHVNAVTSAQPMVTVTFNLKNAQTVFGQNVYLVGDDAGIGKWDLNNAVLMIPVNYPNWQVKIKLAPSKRYKFKFVKIDGSDAATWESIDNRIITTAVSGSVSINKSWNTP
jgi:alpha-amylase